MKEFITDNKWNREKLLSYVSLEMTEHIIGNISPIIQIDKIDKVVWMDNNSKKFSVKTAWKIVRKKKAKEECMERIWHKGLLFKLNFFLWRAWKRRVATDDNLKKIGFRLYPDVGVVIHNKWKQ